MELVLDNIDELDIYYVNITLPELKENMEYVTDVYELAIKTTKIEVLIENIPLDKKIISNTSRILFRMNQNYADGNNIQKLFIPSNDCFFGCKGNNEDFSYLENIEVTYKIKITLEKEKIENLVIFCGSDAKYFNDKDIILEFYKI